MIQLCKTSFKNKKGMSLFIEEIYMKFKIFHITD